MRIQAGLVLVVLGASLALNVYCFLFRIPQLRGYGEFWREKFLRLKEYTTRLESKQFEATTSSLQDQDTIEMLEARALVVENLLDASTGVEGIKSGIEKVMDETGIGKTWRVVLHNRKGEAFLTVSKYVERTEKLKRLEFDFEHDGKVVFYLPSEPSDKKHQRLVTLARLVLRISALVQNAEIDQDTGLWNKKHLLEELSDEIAIEKRYRRHPLSLAFIDLDEFKPINDTYGHAAGDVIIARFADTLVGHFREADVIARVGGDEFAVMLRYTGLQEAIRSIEKLRRILGEVQHSEIGGQTLQVSVGITEYAEGDTTDEVYKRADRALYRAKRKEGKNRTCQLSKRRA